MLNILLSLSLLIVSHPTGDLDIAVKAQVAADSVTTI
jgi:hypothetical protein